VNYRFGFLVALTACRAAPATHAPPRPLHHEVADEHVTLAARAEQALAADSPLDYDRPFVAKPDPRTETLALFHQACDAGDARSCWRGLSLGDATFVDVVANHCRRGDMSSCRALPLDEEARSPIEGPGSAGRSLACRDPRRTGCDSAALHRECEAGFPESCRSLAGAPDATSQTGATFEARATTLSREGCAAGLVNECEEPKQLCTATRACARYAHMRLAANDATAARDAFELACEYKPSSADTCMELGIRYLDGELPEPVPGRGQRLLDLECHRLLDALKSRDDVIKTRPECKRARLLGE
jgi:hypothetical protein